MNNLEISDLRQLGGGFKMNINTINTITRESEQVIQSWQLDIEIVKKTSAPPFKHTILKSIEELFFLLISKFILIVSFYCYQNSDDLSWDVKMTQNPKFDPI